MAPFHKEMFYLTEDEAHKLIVVMAYRGSGKSTIMNLSYGIWSILGMQKKKFVLVLSKTRSQARDHFANIKSELEYNDLLKSDLGPFEADEGQWETYALELPKFGAKIMCAATEQGVRGLRYAQRRPDLIICDDLEDSVSVVSETSRNATYEWFVNEVLPLGTQNTRIVVLGNLLHAESLLMRLREGTVEKERPGIFRAYPLVDDLSQPLWPARFPSREDIRGLKKSIADENIWTREYLLKILPEGPILILDL